MVFDSTVADAESFCSLCLVNKFDHPESLLQRIVRTRLNIGGGIVYVLWRFFFRAK